MAKANLKQIVRAKYHSMMQAAHRDHAHQTLVNTTERDLIVDTVEEGLVLRERFEPTLLLSDILARVDEIRFHKKSRFKSYMRKTAT